MDALGWGIFGMWTLSFFIDIFISEYDPPPTIHALMMAVVGVAFTATIIRKPNSGDDNVEDE